MKHARQHRLFLNKQSSASSLKGIQHIIDLENFTGESSINDEYLPNNISSYSGSSHPWSGLHDSEFDDKPISGHDSYYDDKSNLPFLSWSDDFFYRLDKNKYPVFGIRLAHKITTHIYDVIDDTTHIYSFKHLLSNHYCWLKYSFKIRLQI